MLSAALLLFANSLLFSLRLSGSGSSRVCQLGRNEWGKKQTI